MITTLFESLSAGNYGYKRALPTIGQLPSYPFCDVTTSAINYETTWLVTRTFYKLLYYVIVLYFNCKVMTKVNESHLKSNIYHLKQTIQQQKGISTILKCRMNYQTAHTQ